MTGADKVVCQAATLLLLFALTSLMGFPYAVLMPVFAGQVLHGGPHTLGWLSAATGVGALTSALSLAVRKSVVGLTRMLQIAAAMLGTALILFGFSRILWLSLVLMVAAGLLLRSFWDLFKNKPAGVTSTPEARTCCSSGPPRRKVTIPTSYPLAFSRG